MRKHGQSNGTTNKVQWVRAIGTWVAALGICVGVGNLLFKKEKEASDRLLHIIALLDTTNCKTVRAGAASTMGVYLDDYKQYQERAFWVMANSLATEEDPLVRHNILNILKGAEVKAIEPLACMNRFLLEEEMRTQSSLLFSFDLAFQSDLDNGSISDELRKKFKDSDVELSECVTVLVVEKDSMWFVTNRDDKPSYIVKKERDQLNVCKKDNLVGPAYVSSSPVSTPIEPAPIDKFSFLRENENLRDITKALVAVLEKKGFPEDEKLHLQEIILCNIESSSKINLDKANLKQASLMGAHLKDVSLKEANLEQADLQDAVLNNVDLADATMTGANLHSVKLEGKSILRGANLTSMLLFSIDPKKFQSDLDKRTSTIPKGLQQEFEDNEIQLANNATLLIKEKGTKYLILSNGKKYRISKEQENLNIYTDAILENATLESVDLGDADLTNANLVDATLTDSNMVNATLQGADLFEADLTRANLAGADLFEADLTRANLVGANLTDANMVNATLQGADFFEADLTDANLVGANLTGANMVNATLQGADLFEADLTEANLARVDLFEADFTDANLAGADLKGAILESAILAGANLKDADLRAALLFGIDPNKFQSDLDKRTISEGLQQEFGYNGIYPSENTIVSVEQKDHRWLINDKGDEQTYTVRKEERLYICTVAMIVLTELFGIDSKKFQSDLDKGPISEDLRQEFENNMIYLSENTTASTKVEDKEWLINEKDYGQTYTVRKEDGQLKIYERTKLDPIELFSIDSKKFQSDFDKVTISEDLRQEFENNGISLSQDTSISIEKQDPKWLINDKDYEQAYIVKKEDDQLKIYEKTKLDPIELFSIDSKKFQSDLDKGTISKDLQQKFENNEISLSQNTTVSIEGKDRRWLITDKDKEQTYTVRKEERLNIYKRTKFDPTDIKNARNWQNAIFDDDVKQKLLNQQN